MLHVIESRNVNHALRDGLQWLAVAGIERPSRNGPVLVAPEPVITVTHNPAERVLFSAYRNANPFFHFMEALWMLAGRNDIEWLAQFNSRMRTYSDDGTTLHGAYGNRWRNLHSMDQLKALTNMLRADPTTRRAVLTMWSPPDDLTSTSKDLPCNTHCYFQVIEGALRMTVLCRSNDALWGAHGANAVHFSMLQEYIARAVGAPLGYMTQFSNNYHVYLDKVDPRTDAYRCWADDRYKELEPYPLMTTPVTSWDNELLSFLDHPLQRSNSYTDSFLSHVAAPMYASWDFYKQALREEALVCARSIYAEDWSTACIEWLQRRYAKREAE